jgi:DNA-directed RNA polymerase beta' subunit
MLSIENDSGGNSRIYGNKFKSPINMIRIINDVILLYKDNSELDPVKAISSINNLLDNIVKLAFNERIKIELPAYWKSSTKLMNIYIRSHLNIANLTRLGISNIMLNIIINMIKQDYSNALIDYGTAVGVISAQSLCEPMTQYVIDAHHRAGGASTKTDHMTKIAEIFGARPTAKLSNPSMFIKIPEKIESDKLQVQHVANMIEMLNIGRFIDSDITVFYEKIGEIRHPNYIMENSFINTFIKNNPANPPPRDIINYCIRMEIDRRELVLKSMTLMDIIQTIHDKFGYLYPVYTPENAEILILRLYLRNEVAKKASNLINTIQDIIEKVKDAVIRGISGIISTEVVEHIKTYIDNSDGAIKQKTIYAIQTRGVNLSEVISTSLVDQYGVYTDSIREIADIYGIEAAREAIVSQLMNVNEATITKGQAYAHFVLYADEMTRSGIVTTIQRNGVGKRESDNIMLMLCTAMPLQVLEEAASRNAKDIISGVSGPLVLGQIPNYGTRFNGVSLNEEFIKEHATNVSQMLEDL